MPPPFRADAQYINAAYQNRKDSVTGGVVDWDAFPNIVKYVEALGEREAWKVGKDVAPWPALPKKEE